MSNYGKQFSVHLFEAAGKLIGLDKEQGKIALMPKEINSVDIWQALKIFIEWFKKNVVGNSLEIEQDKNYTIEEVAKLLLEATILFWDGNKPKEARMQRKDFSTNRWCHWCYEEMIGAFLDVLAGCDINESIKKRMTIPRLLHNIAGVMAQKEVGDKYRGKKVVDILMTAGAMDHLREFQKRVNEDQWKAFWKYVIDLNDLSCQRCLSLDEEAVIKLITDFSESQGGIKQQTLLH